MADLQAPPRNPWLGIPADLLLKIKEVAAAQAKRSPTGKLIGMLLGDAPEALDRMASGLTATEPPQKTGPDPSLATKYSGPAAIAQLTPVGKAASLGKVALAGTFLDRSHLLQLALKEPEMVRKLEDARRASEAAFKQTGDLYEAWRAGSAHLEGTPYAGWLPKTNEYPAMFELSDRGAKLNPRLDPLQDARKSGGSGVSPVARIQVGDLGGAISHPELEKFMPDMPGWQADVVLGPQQSFSGTGSFNSTIPKIQAEASNSGNLLGTLLHEMEHGVASRTGTLPMGSNIDYEMSKLAELYPKVPLEQIKPFAERNYQNDKGEILARVVEKRRNLGPSDIRANPPMQEFLAQSYPEWAPPTNWGPPVTAGPTSASGLSALAQALAAALPPTR